MRVVKDYQRALREASMGVRLSALCRGADREFVGTATAIEVHPDHAGLLDPRSAAILAGGPLYIQTRTGRVPMVFTWPNTNEVSLVYFHGADSWRYVVSWAEEVER
jgi:hypothetical protein